MLRRRICAALRAHLEGEEELVYPEAQARIAEPGLVNRAIEEHGRAQSILDRLHSAAVPAEEADRLMSELRSEIAAHVREEEESLFPEMRRSELDLYALGRAFAARRADRLFELLAPGGAAPIRPIG